VYYKQNKELDTASQSIQAAREIARFVNKMFEVVAEFSIHTLNSIGITFVGPGCMGAGRVNQGFVSGKQDAEIPTGLRSLIQQRL
jgi:hypothetical protein